MEQLFDILIGIIQAITTKLPELIKAGVELLMAFFDGVIDALSGIDVNVLVKGIAGIGYSQQSCSLSVLLHLWYRVL